MNIFSSRCIQTGEEGMRMGRPIPPIEVSEEQRATLEAWTRRRKTAQALAQRARVVLLCAAGKSNTEVARILRQSNQRVGKWRSRFLAPGVEGLLDEPRPGAPRPRLHPARHRLAVCRA